MTTALAVRVSRRTIRPGPNPPGVTEIAETAIKGDQHPTLGSSPLPEGRIAGPLKAQVPGIHRIMAQAPEGDRHLRRDVLIQEEPHAWTRRG